MEKKYILTDDVIDFNGHTLHRIKAVRDFDCVKAGNLGGFIESEKNLDHDGNAWVADNARVAGDARVSDNAMLFGNAWVADNARVAGDARVSDNAMLFDNAWVFDNAMLSDNAMLFGNARLFGDAWVAGNARLFGDAWVAGTADFAVISGFGRASRTTTFFRCRDNLVRCKCGCFYGTVDEFRSKVGKTHGNSKYAKEYLMIADLMELHFKED